MVLQLRARGAGWLINRPDDAGSAVADTADRAGTDHGEGVSQTPSLFRWSMYGGGAALLGIAGGRSDRVSTFDENALRGADRPRRACPNRSVTLEVPPQPSPEPPPSE